MRTDSEFREFGDSFQVDDKWRTLTADRFSWNMFRRASDVWACANETEAISAAGRDREVVAMFADKSSAVTVEVAETVKPGCLF